jgi:hypothetical protein
MMALARLLRKANERVCSGVGVYEVAGIIELKTGRALELLEL